MAKDNIKETDYEINLLSLFRRIILRWRLIVLIAVIFGLIGGVLEYKNQLSRIESQKKEIEEMASIISNNPEEEIDTKYLTIMLENAIRDQYRYITHSQFYTLKKEGYCASALVYINSGENSENDLSSEGKTILNGKTGSIQSALTRCVYNDIDYSPMLAELDVPGEAYLKEFIVVENEANNFIVSVYNTDQSKAESLLNYILEHLFDRKEELLNTFGDFRCSTIKNNTCEIANYEPKWLTERVNELNSLITTKNNYDQNKKVIKPTASLTEDSYDNLTVSKKSIVKNMVVMAAIGTCIITLLIGVLLIFNNTILDGSDFINSYMLNSLAVLPITRMKGKTLKKADIKIANFGREVSGKESVSPMIMEEINKLNPGETICILTNDDLQCAEEIKKSIEKFDSLREYISISKVLDNVDSMQMLNRCQGAIVLVESECITNKKLIQILNLLNNKGISLIGAIAM